MLRYLLREGLFGPGTPFPIANQHGWAPLTAVPSAPWRDTLTIRDRAGIERATLCLRRTASGPLHVITRGPATLALVVRERRWLAPQVAVRLERGAVHAAGDFARACYRIVRRGAVVARVSRCPATPGAVAVDVEPGEQDALLLAACIAIQALAQEP